MKKTEAGNQNRKTADRRSFTIRVYVSVSLVGLKEKHIDTHQSAIKILGKGNKERVVPIKHELLKVINEYRQQKKQVFEEFDTEFLLVQQ
jgi:site-specific recombinase XerD